MTSSIRILPATSTDIDTISGFQCAMALETENIQLDPKISRAGVAGIFEIPQRGRYLIAKDSDKIVGSTLVQREWSDWRCGEVWWIHSVYVLPDYRRRGIFRQIYAHLKDEGARDPLFRGLRLFVEKENITAQRVYRSLGMSDEHYALFEWLK